jgi:hypothetical protein
MHGARLNNEGQAPDAYIQSCGAINTWLLECYVTANAFRWRYSKFTMKRHATGGAVERNNMAMSDPQAITYKMKNLK